MPWAESSPICARRQVTTEPLDRRTIRRSRLPSSLLMDRTCTRCTISHLLRGRQDQTRQDSGKPDSSTRANVHGRGTRPGRRRVVRAAPGGFTCWGSAAETQKDELYPGAIVQAVGGGHLTGRRCGPDEEAGPRWHPPGPCFSLLRLTASGDQSRG